MGQQSRGSRWLHSPLGGPQGPHLRVLMLLLLYNPLRLGQTCDLLLTWTIQQGERLQVVIWLKTVRILLLRDISFAVSEEASCHAVSWPMEGTTWQAPEGGLCPPARKTLQPSGWILPTTAWAWSGVLAGLRLSETDSLVDRRAAALLAP